MMCSVKSVNLSGQKQIADISPLSSLTRLEHLSLAGVPVTDLQPLKRLKCLEKLSLWSTPLDEIGDLTEMTSLRYLDLEDTNVSAEQVEKLQAALPDCSISR